MAQRILYRMEKIRIVRGLEICAPEKTPSIELRFGRPVTDLPYAPHVITVASLHYCRALNGS